MINTKNWPQYAPVVLRLGLAVVYTWFGVSQLINTAQWVGLVPGWATGWFGLSAVNMVHINGTFEIIAALMIAIGIYVRPIALLLFLHLLMIAGNFGLTATGVRDFGLSFATLALALFGSDRLCFSYESDHPSVVRRALNGIKSFFVR